MKHFLALLLASVGLMLTPTGAFTQDSPGAPAKADAQSSPAPAAPAAAPPTTIKPTVINLPPPPFYEFFLNTGATVTPGAALNCPCPQNAGLQVGRFAAVTTQTGAKTGVDTRFALETGFAAGFAKIHSITLVAEFPVVFNLNGDVRSGNLSVARSYSSLFFTPALRIMYAPDRDTHPGYLPLYPWFSLGGGLARYNPSTISLAGGASGAKSSTEGALQAGAGVDFGIYRRAIALRAGVRDLYSAPPNLGVTGINLRHNVVASAGIVFRFCKHCWDLPTSGQQSPTASPAHN